ncbi:MAG: Mrp/NBP35 family ATP-binding protein [Pseudomonadota bacterium]
MAATNQQAILDTLRTIADPASGKDIVTSGLVTNVVNKDGNVAIVIEIPANRAKEMEATRKAAEEAVQSMAGVVSTTVVLTAEAAGQESAHPPATPKPSGPQPVPGVRTLLAVASGKGGVGKSTTAVNLALAFAANGLRVGILDTDVFGPSVPRMMGITGKPDSADGTSITPLKNHGVVCMSVGFLVDPDSPVIWRGPIVMRAVEQMLRQVRWGELDVLVLDLPPGTGDVQLTLSQSAPLTGAIIVSTPQDLALLDTRRGLNMFREVHVPVLGILENMSYFICPHCGDRASIFGHGGAREEAKRLGVDFLGEIPLAVAIRTRADEGLPITVAEPDGEHAKAYRTIAERLWKKLAAQAADRPALRLN